jgi:hypothetical protein
VEPRPSPNRVEGRPSTADPDYLNRDSSLFREAGNGQGGPMARPGRLATAARALLLAALLAGPARAEDDDPASAGLGRLEGVARITRRLLPLTVEKATLRLDRDAWSNPREGKAGEDLKSELEAILVKQGLPKEWAARQAAGLSEGSDAERVFSVLQIASRSSGSSRSSGGSERSMHFSGGGLAGRLSLSGDAVHIELREEAPAGRALEVVDDGAGGLRLSAGAGAKGDFLLVIQQSREGRVSVAHIEGGRPFAAAGGSFPAFYRENRDYVDRRLLPLLARLGVGTPPATDSDEMKAAVLSRLRPVTGEERREVDRLLRQLDDADHAKREEATRRLSGRGDRHRGPIEEALKDASITPEAAERLKRVVAETRSRRRDAELAAALKLDEDPDFLVRLLGPATDAERPFVAAALEKATGQRLGADAASWMKWLDARKPADAAPATTPAKPKPD